MARIPFDTKGDTVTSVVPQLYYEDDLTFLRGLEGGIKITGTNVWKLNALGRLRFFDIPKRFQNEIQEDTVDLGLQLRYLPWANAFVEWELLSDQDFRFHSKHHRSAIFETASHFGRIKGGSNYNTVYLQWHF